MSIVPQVTIQSKSAPYPVISQINYCQSAIGGNNLPIPQLEISNLVFFRVYNNFGLSQSVKTMYNVYLTVFDGPGAGSHTGLQSVSAQSWIRIYETGFGESTVTPGAYTQYQDTDTAIGKSGLDIYIPTYGSDGNSGDTNNYIRAGVDGNGVGFIEFATYTELPDVVGFANYNCAISVIYDFI